MKSAVSVIIPTYNRAGMIGEAIRSVLEQSYSDFELIVVDDGSGDETREVLEEFGPRIRVLYRPHRGVSCARNEGIRKATGNWLAFLDSDDLWLPEKLEAQMAYVGSNPECRIVHTDEIWIRNGRRVNPRLRHKKGAGRLFERSLELCVISPTTVMVHRSLFERLGLFDESLPACEDYDMWLRATLHYPVHFIERPLAIKRGGHPDQLSKAIWGLDRFRTLAIEKILSDPAMTPEYEKAARAALRNKLRILADGSRRRGKLEEAEEYLARLEASGE